MCACVCECVCYVRAALFLLHCIYGQKWTVKSDFFMGLTGPGGCCGFADVRVVDRGRCGLRAHDVGSCFAVKPQGEVFYVEITV